ncbi:uncharacterized protein TRIADDRAFT_63704 [Trichoplax adhaerens]|uniref:SPRY domain-containing SOCS box protein 3 n=1 Tax=Trichoplax adhaerens TaxID=10228 RepID=B3RMJ7_TRIAD|nr:hypothetical protein TRIADDRAFT_63704 [Trichoplax adhaerens]EDV27861.1 hypothetical protein TRIADDRAFT_63704 [Trichoplax adhaerens]|eukprot:XP_002109695.1 hypothetical protein TRIADDRAFT_63704 [Trichoplax adhaerens]
MVATCAIGPIQEAFPDNWTWNIDDKSPDVELCSRREGAYFYTDPVIDSTGTAAVRGSKGFDRGLHYWEVTLCEPTFGSSVMVGVGTKKAKLRTNNYEYIDILGTDCESWGLNYKGYLFHNGRPTKFTDTFYAGTTIGVLLDMNVGKLSYFKNGSFLGTAFDDLLDINSELYPMIASTAAESEMQLGIRGSKFVSLEDLCRRTVRRYVDYANIDKLCLPQPIRNELKVL